MTLAPPAETSPLRAPSRARRVTAWVCFGVPALAMVAFGGQLLVTGWTTDRAGGAHHVHDLAWGAMEGLLLLVALVAALTRRRSRPSAVLQAVAVVAALLVTMLLVATPDPFTLVLALLVGGGAAAVGGLRGRLRPEPLPLALGALAAGPLLVWALRAASDQRRDADAHAELLGYTGVAAFALSLLLVLLVASLRRPGWRVTSLSAAAAAAVVGVAGLLWPDDASSPGTIGGVALLVLAAAVAAGALPARSGGAVRS